MSNDDVSVLLKINLETVASLPDDDLVELGEIAGSTIATLRQKADWLNGEVLRRITNKGPEATRIKTNAVLVVREVKPTYEWNPDKAREILAPHATDAEMKRAFKVKEPPPPPKEVVTVQTQTALALAKAAGLEDAIAEAYRKKDGPPTLKYTRLDAPVVAATDADEEPFE